MTHTHEGRFGRTRTAEHNGATSSLICPITARRCEGDLSYLCEDYGCARKGGLSPHSEENACSGVLKVPAALRPTGICVQSNEEEKDDDV
jgi:hypothetical protein